MPRFKDADRFELRNVMKSTDIFADIIQWEWNVMNILNSHNMSRWKSENIKKNKNEKNIR